jgi:hypothetical protein
MVGAMHGARHALAWLAFAPGCAASDDASSGDSQDVGAVESTGESDDATGSTGAGSTITTTTTSSSTSSTTEDGSSSGDLPEGPSCSVQVVTHGELFDPVVKGESAGVIPTSVGDALEDYCGCHTLMSNAQNLQHPFLQAPGGTLFLQYEDFLRGYGGSSLGEACGSEVRGYRMPVGSCPFPDSAAELLIKWFDDGMPDGATFEPP